MSIFSGIIDGYGRGNKAKVNGEGELSVVVHPHPPIDEDVDFIPFSQFFTDDGTATGTSDMTVTGTAAAPVDYYISASSEYDIYIKTISIQLGDNGTARLDHFAVLGAALTNGLEMIYFNNDLAEYNIVNVKTNQELMRFSTGKDGFGAGTTAFQTDVTGGGGEATYLPDIDLAQRFGMPYGLRLRKSSEDRIIFRVQDDLSTVVTFNIRGYGARI